jgi:hypothetical protein
MYRVAVALSLLLGASRLADAQAPLVRPVPKASPGDEKPTDVKPSDTKPTDAKPSDTKPTDAKPSKEQVAKEKEADAAAIHATALENADRAMKRLEDLLGELNKGSVENITARIENEAAAVAKVQDVKREFHSKLSALGHATARASLDGLEKDARKAADDVKHANRDKTHEMRHILKLMKKDRKAKARGIAREAKKLARIALDKSRTLEDAQRRAKEKESVYEGDYLHNELFSEGMMDHAEELGDKAEDKIEDFFDRVEKGLDTRSDAIADEAAQAHRAVGQARSQAEAEVMRAEQNASAKDTKPARTQPAGFAEDPNESYQDAKADDSAPAAAVPGAADIGFATAVVSSKDSPILFRFCGLIAFSGGMAALVVLRSRPTIREPPLLG